MFDAITLIAIIFAVGVLAKMIVAFAKPKKLVKMAERFWSNWMLSAAVTLIAAAVVGYFVLVVSAIDIVEVAAVMLLTMLVLGFTLVPCPEPALKMARILAKEKKRAALKIIVWTAIALWTLWAIFG